MDQAANTDEGSDESLIFQKIMVLTSLSQVEMLEVDPLKIRALNYTSDAIQLLDQFAINDEGSRIRIEVLHARCRICRYLDIPELYQSTIEEIQKYDPDFIPDL
jgi:hypothetical protein